MTLAFDMPECPPSAIARLDPRWKLAALLPVVFALALLQTLGPALVGLAGALVLAALARLPWRWYLRRLTIATVMFLLFLVWLPFVPEEGDSMLDLGMLQVSLTGLGRLAALAAKLVGIISVMLVVLATAPLQETLKAAAALRIPSLLIQLILLTYRYVLLLVDEFVRLRTALRVRGFRNRPDLHSYRTIGQVAGTLLVRSQERAERVSHAMRARGFDGRYRSLSDFATTRTDVLAFAVCLSYAVGLLAWDWSTRAWAPG